MAGLEHYQYPSLDSKKTQIRLLRISSLPLPESFLASLDLTIVDLDDAEATYDAVSYTWGPEGPVHNVIIDGQPMPLRPNICHFLQHCQRRSLPVTWLWIDSICIDQENVVEKGEQVAIMDKIFSKARRVIIWLSEASELNVITEHFSRVEAGDNFAQYCRKRWPYLSMPTVPAPIEENERLPEPLWQQLDLAVGNPYWNRLWIVQEIALASNACVVLGSLLLPFSQMNDLGNIWSSVLVDPKTQSAGAANAEKTGRILMLPGSYEGSKLEYQRLEAILRTYGDRKCTDRRDAIYALLSLRHLALPFDIDYDISLVEFFARTLLYYQVEHELFPDKSIRWRMDDSPNPEAVAREGQAFRPLLAKEIMRALQITSREVVSFPRSELLDREEIKLSLTPEAQWIVYNKICRYRNDAHGCGHSRFADISMTAAESSCFEVVRYEKIHHYEAWSRATGGASPILYLNTTGLLFCQISSEGDAHFVLSMGPIINDVATRKISVVFLACPSAREYVWYSVQLPDTFRERLEAQLHPARTSIDTDEMWRRGAGLILKCTPADMAYILDIENQLTGKQDGDKTPIGWGKAALEGWLQMRELGRLEMEQVSQAPCGPHCPLRQSLVGN